MLNHLGKWCAYGAVSLASVFAVQDARAQVEYPRGLIEGVAGPADLALKQAVMPFSQRLGVAMPAQPAWVEVPQLDLAQVLAEDAADTSGRQREGVAVPIEFDMGMGQWLEVPKGNGGGWLYVCDVRAPGAFGVRLHFKAFMLPKGVEAIVYDPRIPDNLPSPYRYAGPLDSSEFWAWTSWSDTARIEVYYPPEAEAHRFAPHFGIDQVIRMYRDPSTGLVQAYGARELGCHNDLECSPAWINNGAGVGRMSFVIGASSFACSGQMMNNTSGDLTPYFMTARHCMEDNGGALASLDVYWFYQRAGCTGSVPAIGSCPRSNSSTYVRTDSDVDMSMVMIEGVVPRNLWWSGNDSASQSNGTGVVGIHHPRGTRKRISFGTYQSANSCGTSGLVYGFNVDYTSGTVERGSSGSPIFLNNGAFVGVSSCGPTDGQCPSLGYEAIYGKWFVGYGSFMTFVNNPGFDDSSEDNDSCGAATNLNNFFNGTLYSRWVKSTDQDWYRRTVPAFGSVTFHTRFTHANGDIDLRLHDGCGAALASSTGTTDDETITWTNPGSTPREVYLNVFLYNDTRNIYYLDFATYAPVAPSNNTCSSAPTLGVGGLAFGTTQGASVDGAANCTNTGNAPDVWHVMNSACARTVTLNMQGSEYDTVLSVHTGCPGTAANQVACNDDIAPGVLYSYLTFNAAAGQNYYIRVGGYNGAFGRYSLRTSGSVASNDLCANTVDVNPGTYAFNNCTCETDGPADEQCRNAGSNQIFKDFWLAYTPGCYGTLEANTFGSAFDTKIAIYANPDNSSCPSGPNSAIACNDDINGAFESQVVFNCVPGQRYIFRVGSFDAAVGRPGIFRIIYTPGDPCTPPAGACCTDGVCAISAQADCLNGGGAWLGEGTTCDDPNACVPLPVGACCIEGVCDIRDEEDCLNNGGTWYGAGTNCDDPAICEVVPVGACCTEGVCTLATEADCTGNGGVWTGPGTDCENPAVCEVPTGACCVAQWCSITTQAECAALAGSWSQGGVCEDGHCVVNTCGTADFNHDGDVGTDADIEAYFACLGGDCCPTCDTADFDGDGDVGTDADIESFFRVLSGGLC